MEIYSKGQLEKVLNTSSKTIIIELMDMNDQEQNELHFDINKLVLNQYENVFLLLKINKNFFTNLFTNIKQYPTFIIYKNQKQLEIVNNISSLNDFELFIKSKI